MMKYSNLKIAFFIAVILIVFSSCEKDEVLIPGLQPTYTIEETTVNGQTLFRITGTINQTVSLTANNTYLLSGLVFVEDTLSIEAGTTIYAETNSPSALIIARKAKILALGNANNPIVFTSLANLTGTPSQGDWVGLHMNGQASLNTRSSALSAVIGKYGRTDIQANDEDNSGSLQYVRVEYAGKALGESTGAININGVGSLTQLDYVQVYQSLGNGIRFRGGTARLKHAVATQSYGKAYRWDAGWRGLGQYWVAHYPQTTTDTLTAIEGRSGALDNLPISNPVLSNITVVGLGTQSSDPQVRGIRFRDSTHGKIYNSLITNCRRAVRADNSTSFINNQQLVFANNNLHDNNPDYYDGSTSQASLFSNASFNNTQNIVTMDGFVGTSPGGTFSVQNLNPWFDAVTYKGAVPASNNWTASWIRE